MGLQQAFNGATAGLGKFRGAIVQTTSTLARLGQSSGVTASAVGKIKTSAGQTDPALNRMRTGTDKASASLGKLRTAATQSGTGLGKIKASAGQTDPALKQMKTGTDKVSTSLGKLRTAASQGGTGLGQMKSMVGQTDGSLGKARGGADRLKASLDRLKAAAGGSKTALKDVKSQADAVEKSVGKAGKNADGTGKSMGGLGKGLKGASLAQKGLNLAMAASPFGLIMTLLAPLIAQFVNMDKVTAVLKKGMEIAWKGIKSATSSAKDFLMPLLKGIVNLYTTPIRGLIGMLNAAIGGINGISVDIPGWVPVYGGRHFGLNIPRLPNVPALAEGGVVQPRNGGQLALLAEAGEPEAVIPLSKLNRILSQGGAPSGAALHRMAQAMEKLAERPVHVQVDSQTIARAVLVGQRQLARR
ncbi:hypothetical protein [Streptomyces sp. H27-D2]|uniref:hypothetical protein n=1 Tax=Streptomyces sp. H27-D2 TaxID=3046304 RepID=UPI002DB75D8A|nr:hypothetical protein [Streptomyces sp. H27-D2]MEC4016402.1 hypothetical protein [Streptomyces sp. H27-D2]